MAQSKRKGRSGRARGCPQPQRVRRIPRPRRTNLTIHQSKYPLIPFLSVPSASSCSTPIPRFAATIHPSSNPIIRFHTRRSSAFTRLARDFLAVSGGAPLDRFSPQLFNPHILNLHMVAASTQLLETDVALARTSFQRRRIRTIVPLRRRVLIIEVDVEN